MCESRRHCAHEAQNSGCPAVRDQPAALPFNHDDLAEKVAGLHGSVARRFRVPSEDKGNDRLPGVPDVNDAVRDPSPMFAVQEDVTRPNGDRIDRLHGQRVAVADRRLHARAARAKADAVSLFEQPLAHVEKQFLVPLDVHHANGSAPPAGRSHFMAPVNERCAYRIGSARVLETP
jgi:hypothetical protein